MKPILHPSTPEQLNVPVTRRRKCPARRGAILCNREFVQNATSATGDYVSAAANPETVHWVPEHCAHCERAMLRALQPDPTPQ